MGMANLTCRALAVVMTALPVSVANAEELHLECYIENRPKPGATPSPAHSIQIDVDGDVLMYTEQGSVIKYSNISEAVPAYTKKTFFLISSTMITFGVSTVYNSSGRENSFSEARIDRTNGRYEFGYGSNPIGIPKFWVGACQPSAKKKIF